MAKKPTITEQMAARDKGRTARTNSEMERAGFSGASAPAPAPASAPAIKYDEKTGLNESKKAAAERRMKLQAQARAEGRRPTVKTGVADDKGQALDGSAVGFAKNFEATAKKVTDTANKK